MVRQALFCCAFGALGASLTLLFARAMGEPPPSEVVIIIIEKCPAGIEPASSTWR
jgi:hypothetical protein